MRRRWALFGIVVYALAVVLVLLAPVSYGGIISAITDRLSSTFGMTGFGSGWVEFAANILLFAPLGFLLTVLTYPRLWGFLSAIGLSISAELVQILIPSRQPSLRDVLANSLGAIAGAGAAWAILALRRRAMRAKERRSKDPGSVSADA